MKKVIIVFFSLIIASMPVLAESISGKAVVQVYSGQGTTNFRIGVAPQSSYLNGSYHFEIQDDDDHPRFITATISDSKIKKSCTIPETSLTTSGIPIIDLFIPKLRKLQVVNPNVGQGNYMFIDIYDNPGWPCRLQFLY